MVTWSRGVLAALVGAVVAVVLGFLTFGAQTTVAPDGVPVAVSVPEQGPAQAVAQRLTGQGGDQLAWRVTTPAEGRALLEDKEVYGVLELGQTPVVVVSGAVNPTGTQVAQQALTGVAQALSQGAPVRVETLHPASAAGRAAPMALSALAWVGALAGGAVLALLARRAGGVAVTTRLTLVGGTTVLVTGVLTGFLWLWDDTLPLNGEVLGFLTLAVAAFAAVQAAVLRLLGIRAMAVLGPLYLVAPAVAGTVPELLNPAYRVLLWSWTPFRFFTEGLRSLLLGTPDAPDVTTALWVFAGLLIAGLVVLLLPGKQAEPDPPGGVVDVGVDQADRLPGAQGEHAADHRQGGVRR
nr:ABC transporter permease [Amycolatopsis suaedae]